MVRGTHDEAVPTRKTRKAFDLGKVDPRFFYVSVLPPTSGQESTVQGFSRERMELSWVFEIMARLPAALPEPTLPIEVMRGMRAAGQMGWRHLPVRIDRLLRAGPQKDAPFWIVFTGDLEVAKVVAAWQSHSRYRPLHVSVHDVEGAIRPNDITIRTLKRHCLQVVNQHPDALGHLKAMFQNWKEVRPKRLPFPFRGHFTLTPNQTCLETNGRTSRDFIPEWVGASDGEFEDAIEQTFRAVLDVRDEAIVPAGIRMLAPRPAMWLVAPSWLPDLRTRLLKHATDKDDEKAISCLVQIIEKQRSFVVPAIPDQLELMNSSKTAVALHGIRRRELSLFASAIGWATAGTLAASWRLRPSVNRVIGQVRQFTDHIRKVEEPDLYKLEKLFDKMQAELLAAIDPRAVEQLKEADWGVKIVSDVPVEWLPIGDLPLCLHHDVSRHTATPADGLLARLETHEVLRLAVKDFSEILVVSAFRKGEQSDNIGSMLDRLEQLENTRVRLVRVSSADDLVTAVNDYCGPVMIFDGHGGHPYGGDAYLLIDDKHVTVASLADRIRMPPIVVLSACDTHAAARSTSTVANALLHLGARTVLGTSVSVRFDQAAIMIAHLVVAIDKELPNAGLERGRVVQWSEFVGALLRRQFFHDVLAELRVAGRIDENRRLELLSSIAAPVRRSGQAALDHLRAELVARGGLSNDELSGMLRSMLLRSDVIRYIQLGNPETITVGSLEDILPDRGAERATEVERLRPKWKIDGARPENAVDGMELLGLRPYGPVGRQLPSFRD